MEGLFYDGADTQRVLFVADVDASAREWSGKMTFGGVTRDVVGQRISGTRDEMEALRVLRAAGVLPPHDVVVFDAPTRATVFFCEEMLSLRDVVTASEFGCDWSDETQKDANLVKSAVVVSALAAARRVLTRVSSFAFETFDDVCIDVETGEAFLARLRPDSSQNALVEFDACVNETATALHLATDVVSQIYDEQKAHEAQPREKSTLLFPREENAALIAMRAMLTDEGRAQIAVVGEEALRCIAGQKRKHDFDEFAPVAPFSASLCSAKKFKEDLLSESAPFYFFVAANGAVVLVDFQKANLMALESESGNAPNVADVAAFVTKVCGVTPRDDLLVPVKYSNEDELVWSVERFMGA